jgi:hypothetical protein
MEKKKFTTVAEVAKELGLNHNGLKLLDFLDQYYPEDALDIDYIRERAASAAAVKEKYLLENGTSSEHRQQADHLENEVLMGGLGYSLSKHELISNAVDKHYYKIGSNKTDGEVKLIAMALRPKLESLFAKYPTGDEEFTASGEYDDLVEKLQKKVVKLCEKRDELPF